MKSFLAATAALAASGPALASSPAEPADLEARAALSLVYDGDFHGASARLAALARAHDSDPVLPYLQALALEWRLEQDPADRAHDAEVLALADRALGLAALRLGRDPLDRRALLARGAPHGVKSRLHLFRWEKGPASREAVRLREALVAARDAARYCPLRSETNVRRCTLSPEEVARTFMEYFNRRKVFGLFLSSAVINNPDFTMDKINTVARLLRYKHNFRGYIHLKIIPGASDAAIEDAMALSTAVSLNIETPGQKHFSALSLKKDYNRDIMHPLKLMGRLTASGEKFSRVKCTTQFIVGASDETDAEIIKYMFGLYTRLNFKRVYFSPYQQGFGHSAIPG